MKRGSKCIGRTINLSNPETCIRPKRIQKLVEAMQPCPSHVGNGSAYWTPRPVAIKICTWKDMRRTCPPKESYEWADTISTRGSGETTVLQHLYGITWSIRSCVYLELARQFGVHMYSDADGSLMEEDSLPSWRILVRDKICDCSPKAPSKTASQRLCAALLFLLKSSVAAGLVYWTNAEGLWGSSDDAEDLYYRLMATIAAVFSDDYDTDQIELPRVGEFKYRMIQTYNRAVFMVMNCIVETSIKLREQIRYILSPQENEQEPEESSDGSANGKNRT